MMKRSISDQTLSHSSEDSRLQCLVESELKNDCISPDLTTDGVSNNCTINSNNEGCIEKKDGFLVPDLPASVIKNQQQQQNSNSFIESKTDKFKKSKLISRSTSNIFKGLESEGPIVVSDQTSPSKKKYGSIPGDATVSKVKGKSVGKSVSSFFMKKSTSKDSLMDEVTKESTSEGSSLGSSGSTTPINNISSSANQILVTGTIKKKEESLKSKIDSFFKGSGGRSSLKVSTDSTNSLNNQTCGSYGSNISLVNNSGASNDNILMTNPNYYSPPQTTPNLLMEDDFRSESDLSDDYDSDFDEDDLMDMNGGGIRKRGKNHRNKSKIHSRTESNTSNKSASSVDNLNSLITNNANGNNLIPSPKASSSEPTLSTFTNIDTSDMGSEDTKKLLERRLQRRPTVHELEFDNILSQNDFEDVAIAQKQIAIKNQKLFVGTRPSKKSLFYTDDKSKIISTTDTDSNNNTNTSSNNSSISSGKEISIENCDSNICMLLILGCQGWKRENDLESINDQQQQNSNTIGILKKGSQTTTTTIAVEEIENEFSHYLESFCKDKHKNYYAYDPSFVPTSNDIGPVIISIKRESERTINYRKLKKKKDKSKVKDDSNNSNNNNNNNGGTSTSAERKFKTIIRTREGEDRFYLSSGKSSPRELINTIKSFFLPQLSELNFKKLPNNSESRKLLQYWESAQMTKEYKFGLLYRKRGQVNENDFFSNQEESKEYQEFLEFIGTNIKLKGWDQYKGGLDIKNDSTGLNSIFTTKEVTINESTKIKYQIMFHVSTLLPYNYNDPQQLERKRHIGNDIVVLIFQDYSTSPPFIPSMIKSEFNHVFVIVQPIKKESEDEITKYSVSIAYKDGVSNFGPTFSSSKIWKKDNVFLDYLITKLINGEKASYYSPAFYDKMKRTRLNLLMNIVNTYNSDI